MTNDEQWATSWGWAWGSSTLTRSVACKCTCLFAYICWWSLVCHTTSNTLYIHTHTLYVRTCSSLAIKMCADSITQPPSDSTEGCVWGDIQGGCPWDPPDCLGCVWGDIQGGSWDVLGILRTAWAVCVGTTREDPGVSMGSSRLPGGLCMWGQLGRILGSP